LAEVHSKSIATRPLVEQQLEASWTATFGFGPAIAMAAESHGGKMRILRLKQKTQQRKAAWLPV
jgi:hypothetical protein